jgi:hypothetical protein
MSSAPVCAALNTSYGPNNPEKERLPCQSIALLNV